MFKVPDNTSIYDNEFKPEQYVVPFAPELVGFILADKKLSTYRYGSKYDYLRPGDIVGIQNSDSKEIVGKAKVTMKRQTTFKDLPLNTGTHETYKDKEHQRQVLSGYYAYVGRPVADKDLFLVIDFKLIK